MKNTVNKLALLLGVIAASTLSATAQEGGRRGPGGPGGPGARPPREVPAEVLEKFDADKDGKLNAEERRAAAADRKAKWDAMSEDERKEATAKRRKEMEERRAAWQKLTPEKRKAQMEERMKKRFDKDGDGELNETEKGEMEKAQAEMQKRMQDRAGRRGGRGGPGRGDQPAEDAKKEAPKG